MNQIMVAATLLTSNHATTLLMPRSVTGAACPSAKAAKGNREIEAMMPVARLIVAEESMLRMNNAEA